MPCHGQKWLSNKLCIIHVEINFRKITAIPNIHAQRAHTHALIQQTIRENTKSGMPGGLTHSLTHAHTNIDDRQHLREKIKIMWDCFDGDTPAIACKRTPLAQHKTHSKHQNTDKNLTFSFCIAIFFSFCSLSAPHLSDAHFYQVSAIGFLASNCDGSRQASLLESSIWAVNTRIIA